MHIDTNRMFVSSSGRHGAIDCSPWKAERLGRESAFKDIATRGFAAAYNQSAVHDGSMDFYSPGHDFMYGYRQVVMGYWMSGLLEEGDLT